MKRKVLTSLILCIILRLSSMSIVFANTGDPLEYDDTLGNYNKQNNFYYNQGKKEIESKITTKSYPKVKESKSLNIVNYSQGDSDWANKPMGSTEGWNCTIGISGCLLTSFTMINDYYASNDDPGEVNDTLGKYACPFWWSTAANKYNLTLETRQSISNNNYAKTFIKGALRNNTPVIVGFDKGGSTHYVVATGFDIMNDDTEYYYINDPGSKDYPIIQDYLDAGYRIHRVGVYTD